MKITVFGASGRTGILLIEQALEAGHEVTAFVRTPSKLTVQHERLRVVHGDIREADKVKQAVKGAEAVVSVLGPTSNEPVYAVSKGMENVMAAMEKHGARRLIQSVGAGVHDPKDRPTLLGKFIGLLVRTFSRYVYEDMKRVSDLIRAGDLDWTIVRVPVLTDGEKTGLVRIGYLGGDVGTRVTRADMAAFMLDQLEEDTYLHKAPVISN